MNIEMYSSAEFATTKNDMTFFWYISVSNTKSKCIEIEHGNRKGASLIDLVN